MKRRNDAPAEDAAVLYTAIMNTLTIRNYGINKNLNPIRIKH